MSELSKLQYTSRDVTTRCSTLSARRRQQEQDGASRADGGSLQKSSGAGTQWPPLLFSPPLLPLPGSNVNPARAHGLGSNEQIELLCRDIRVSALLALGRADRV
ncbi:hypothetical protein SRHO_G00044810 [Serrasalmus rhombeus]